LPHIIVDGHEDIAFNAINLHRDFLKPIEALRSESNAKGTLSPTLCLPELEKGNVKIVFATLFAAPCSDRLTEEIGGPCYNTPDEAHAQALDQLKYYKELERQGHVAIIESREQLDEHLSTDQTDKRKKTGLVILMEGADPIRSPSEVVEWFRVGVRIVGPAWRRTRYSGGTGAPGPLSPEGRELVKEMESVGMILDTSHLSEESFFEALDLFDGPIIASHSNSRAYTPTDRQLSDEMIKELVSKGGVIGTTIYNKFLDPAWYERGREKSEVTFAHAVRHIRVVCDLAGDRLHSAIGSDLDGGFGVESTPAELDTVADLQRLGSALQWEGFSETDTTNILGENWIRLLRKSLPAEEEIKQQGKRQSQQEIARL